MTPSVVSELERRKKTFGVCQTIVFPLTPTVMAIHHFLRLLASSPHNSFASFWGLVATTLLVFIDHNIAT
jgi:hypothetical protein